METLEIIKIILSVVTMIIIPLLLLVIKLINDIVILKLRIDDYLQFKKYIYEQLEKIEHNIHNIAITISKKF